MIGNKGILEKPNCRVQLFPKLSTGSKRLLLNAKAFKNTAAAIIAINMDLCFYFGN